MSFIANWSFWIFVAAVWIVFLACRGTYWRRVWLLIASLGVVASSQPLAAGLLLLLGLISYGAGRQFARKESRKALTLAWCIGIIVVYLLSTKVAGDYLHTFLSELGFVSQLLVPVGLSYFSFKLIHYLMESWWNTLPEHGVVDVMLYLFFFPIFPVGPIERFERFQKNDIAEFEWSLVAQGMWRVVLGLFKKIVITDTLIKSVMLEWGIGISRPADLLQGDHTPSVGLVWAVLFLYFVYCYLDFSAVTDIAVGISAWFGYRICENFNYPLTARNIGDFWRRWHMSLANWVQRYIYFPLVGVTRKHVISIAASMITIGLWHHLTLNWLCWGIHHALGLCGFLLLQNGLRRRPKWQASFKRVVSYPVAWLATMSFVALGYCFVGTDSPGAAMELFAIAVGLGGGQ